MFGSGGVCAEDLALVVDLIDQGSDAVRDVNSEMASMLQCQSGCASPSNSDWSPIHNRSATVVPFVVGVRATWQRKRAK